MTTKANLNLFIIKTIGSLAVLFRGPVELLSLNGLVVQRIVSYIKSTQASEPSMVVIVMLLWLRVHTYLLQNTILSDFSKSF